MGKNKSPCLVNVENLRIRSKVGQITSGWIRRLDALHGRGFALIMGITRVLRKYHFKIIPAMHRMVWRGRACGQEKGCKATRVIF